MNIHSYKKRVEQPTNTSSMSGGSTTSLFYSLREIWARGGGRWRLSAHARKRPMEGCRGGLGDQRLNETSEIPFSTEIEGCVAWGGYSEMCVD